MGMYIAIMQTRTDLSPRKKAKLLVIVLVKLMSRGYGVVVSAISRESCHGTTNTSKHRGACRQETRDRLYFSLNYPEKCGHEKECLRP